MQEDGVWALNLQNASNKMLARKSEESLSEEGGEAYQGDGVVEASHRRSLTAQNE